MLHCRFTKQVQCPQRLPPPFVPEHGAGDVQPAREHLQLLSSASQNAASSSLHTSGQVTMKASFSGALQWARPIPHALPSHLDTAPGHSLPSYTCCKQDSHCAVLGLSVGWRSLRQGCLRNAQLSSRDCLCDALRLQSKARSRRIDVAICYMLGHSSQSSRPHFAPPRISGVEARRSASTRKQESSPLLLYKASLPLSALHVHVTRIS